MSEKRRVAVLGLYRSGSSATAGVLHHLGVGMGEPYFRDYYEPLLLSRKLRLWWREPHLQEMMPREARVRSLADWIIGQEQKGALWVGAKHPLLSARGEDLLEAWGPDVRFIWTHRPVEQSIDSTLRLRWWTPAQCESIQRRLWDELHRFFLAAAASSREFRRHDRRSGARDRPDDRIPRDHAGRSAHPGRGRLGSLRKSGRMTRGPSPGNS